MVVMSHDIYADQKEDIFKRKEGKRDMVFLSEFGKTQVSLPVCQSIFFPFGFTWEEAVVCHIRNPTARPLNHIHCGPV